MRKEPFWQSRVFLLCSSLLVALLILEFFLRGIMTASHPFVIAHPVFNHIWSPQSEIFHNDLLEPGEAPFVRVTNSRGWLTSTELDPEPAPSERRIFFMGDSFTEGTVPERRSMPWLVGRFLEERATTTSIKPVVVNTGTTSYSPLLHYLRYRDEISFFKPSVLVISVDMTDVFDDFLYQQAATFDNLGEPIACPANSSFAAKFQRTARGVREIGTAEYALDRLSYFSAVVRFINVHALKNLLYHSRPLDGLPKTFDWCMVQRPIGTDKQVNMMLDNLARLLTHARKNKVIIVVSAVPHLAQLTGQWSLKPFEEVAQTAVAHGAHYVDSLNVIRQALGEEDPQSFYFPNDMHFNSRGYAAWARGYIDWFDENFELLVHSK